MNDEQIKNIIDGKYDQQREDSIRSMLRDFYNRKMLSTVVFVWVWGLFVVGVAIYSAIRFFEADQIRPQIMYAAIFVAGCQFMALMKIFAWQMIHRNSIKREIKRLELRIAELHESLKNR
jgi:multisubunit Na+/H+ antiporter MnhG subunit